VIQLGVHAVAGLGHHVGRARVVAAAVGVPGERPGVAAHAERPARARDDGAPHAGVRLELREHPPVLGVHAPRPRVVAVGPVQPHRRHAVVGQLVAHGPQVHGGDVTVGPMELTHLPPTAAAEDIDAVLRRDGALVVDDLAPPGALDGVAAEMAPYIDATPAGSDDFSGRRTRRSGALVARSPSSHAVVRHPLVLDVTGRLLHRARSFQLHLTQTIAIGPGEPAQMLHRDEWAFDFFDFPADYHVQCNTIWAMTDFTEANGATRLVPGSQELPKRAELTHADSVPAEMTKGSCLFYTGKVFHGGGANRSEGTRVGLNITYNVGWLRQEENQYLSIPLEVAATLDDDFLRLVGYRLGAYALGYIDDARDPIEAVRGRRNTMSFQVDGERAVSP
jgi:hypothetical protein